VSTLADYLALAKANPAFFQNPSHEGIRILLDENEIREIEAQMEANGLPFEQARVGIIYQDAYLRVIRDAVLFPDGKKGIYLRLIEPVDHAPGVIVISAMLHAVGISKFLVGSGQRASLTKRISVGS
jgi:ADP-ribose pyrophosphatase